MDSITTKPKLRFVSSWDDGDALDVKLADMLEKHKLPGIFYLPTHHNLRKQDITGFVERGFEIGGHTVDHPSDMKLLNDHEISYQVRANKQYLERVIKQPITKFCYPRGRYDERVIASLKKWKYQSARTTVILQTKVIDPFSEPTAIHVYQREEYKGRDWDLVAIDMAREASETDGIFHIWGHSWEIARDGNWEKLELLFKHLTETYEIIK